MSVEQRIKQKEEADILSILFLNISTLHIWIHEFYDHSQKSNIDGITFHSSSWRSRAGRRRGWGCPSSPCGTSAPAPTCAPSPAPPPPPAAPCPACPAAPAQPIRCQHAIVLTNHSSPAPGTSSPAPSWSACRHPASGGCSAAPPPANQSEVRTAVTWPALHQWQLTWRLHCRSRMAAREPFQCSSWNTVISSCSQQWGYNTVVVRPP